jgi:hypothetical protein
MLISSRYLTTVCPARCAFCHKPFRSCDGYFEFWRTSDGRHFCSEFCADDAEEAQAYFCCCPVALARHAYAATGRKEENVASSGWLPFA